ncbi:MAG: PQQ-binding-like beta-propeller repeat protein [Armatimonadota bacterium]|jgi:outer membrane protein assembly factor BamB
MDLHSLRRMICLVAIAALLAAPMCVADDFVGWRTDGTGEYPDANPVTTWSDDENIVWKTAMPGESNSLPVIVGDRLFVCSEPSDLLCVDRNTGEILWQVSNEPVDIASADEVADLEEKTEEYNRLRGELGRLGRELRTVRRDLQDDQNNAELRQKHDELRERQGELQEQIAPYIDTWYVRPPAHGYNGYSSATPISDGQHVWAVFGNGIAACYDVEGNRVWARFIEKPPHEWGTSNTPVLADGKLILHIDAMRALDPLTGEEVWSQPEARWNWGTSWVHDYDGVPVLFTSSGDAVRATDGAIIADGLGQLQWGSGPMVADGVLYYIDSQPRGYTSRALRLPETLEEPYETELLWEVTPKENRYYASPIITDGLIYAIAQHNELTCLDAASGETVYEVTLDLGRGTIFGSLVLAGDYLMIVHENGTGVVFQPGREYVEVAKNHLDDMIRSTPVFEGDLMYVRGYENLYCIGATGG